MYFYIFSLIYSVKETKWWNIKTINDTYQISEKTGNVLTRRADRHTAENKGKIFIMGFKRKIIKVMVGGKKSKKLNLKEIFRSANRDQNMSKSYEKEDSGKTRRQETCL